MGPKPKNSGKPAKSTRTTKNPPPRRFRSEKSFNRGKSSYGVTKLYYANSEGSNNFKDVQREMYSYVSREFSSYMADAIVNNTDVEYAFEQYGDNEPNHSRVIKEAKNKVIAQKQINDSLRHHELCNLMLELLDEKGRTAVESNADYSAAYNDITAPHRFFPVDLWDIIRKVYIKKTASTGLKAKLEVDKRLKSCKQLPHEDDGTFHRRFLEILNDYANIGQADKKPPNDEQVYTYLSNICQERFPDHYDHLEELTLETGSNKIPTTLQAAFKLILGYKKEPLKKRNTGTGPTSAAAHHGAYAAQEVRKRKKKRGSKKPKGKQQPQQKDDDGDQSEESSEDEEGDEEEADDGDVQDQATAATNVTPDCEFCEGMGHVEAECYKKIAAQKRAIAQEKKYQANKKKASQSTAANKNNNSSKKKKVHQANVAMVVNQLEEAKVEDAADAMNRVALAGVALTDTDVALDSGATTHIFGNRSVLEEVAKPKTEVHIRGMEGSILKIKKQGNLGPIRGVNYSGDCFCNLLSFSKLQDEGYEMKSGRDSNDKKYILLLSPDGKEYVFWQKGGLYVADASDFHLKPDPVQQASLVESADDPIMSETADDVLAVFDASLLEESSVDDIVAGAATVEENESHLTPEQLKQAKRAVELMENLANISPKMLAQMLNNGNAVESHITPADIRRAMETYGNRKSVTKGKTTHQKADKVRFEMLPPREQQRQTLNVDITWVDKQKFLTCVAKPSNYAMVHAINSRNPHDVGAALHNMIGKYMSYNYKPDVILTDKEGAIKVLTPELERTYPGLKINPTGAGDHVPVIERFHRTLKERARGFYNTLKFTCPASFIKYLVFFCVRGINMSPTRHDKLTPWEVVHQRKINFEIDARLKFGVCVHATNPKGNNSMLSRTETCVSLHPTGNKQGSWYLYNLETGKIIVRSKWSLEPFTAEDIAKLNTKATSEKLQLQRELEFRVGRNRLRIFDDNNAEDDQDNLDEVAPAETARERIEGEVEELGHDSAADDQQPEPDAEPDAVGEHPEQQEEVEDPMEPEATALPTPEEPTPTAEQEPVLPAELDVPSSESQPEPRYGLRPNRTYGSRDGRYDVADAAIELRRAQIKAALLAHEFDRIQSESVDDLVCHVQIIQACKKFGVKAATKAAMIELIEVAKNKKSFKVSKRFKNVDVKKLRKKKYDVLRSMLIFNEKYLATGEFEKLKARLVAGGHLQDRSLYANSEIQSPTVSTESVMMVAAIAAQERRYVATVDIVGAYLHALMKNRKILMTLDKNVVKIIIDIFPKWKEYVNDDGSLHVMLKRALYGCVQSAKLWYDHLSATLLEMGFTPNPKDPCVYNKGVGAEQITICFHVDDLMITSRNEHLIYEAIKQLEDKYKTIKRTCGDHHSYLGLSFDFSGKKFVKITAEKVINNLLGAAKVKTNAMTPALSNLFTIDEDSPALKKEDAEAYHSHVATILYIGKKVRPDLLFATSFLCTRVKNPTEQDWKKLVRCLRYLHKTKHIGIRLSASDPMNSFGLFDASYAIHAGGKSHTGAVYTLGAGAVCAKSSKQSIVAKSSTEAEIIGLSDSTSLLIWMRDFLIHQGYKLRASEIFQDNKSTIILAEKGRSTSDRTRHINVRYFWMKDRIASGEVKINHLPTADMTADILTKPLQGALFIKLRNQLLNWKDHR